MRSADVAVNASVVGGSPTGLGLYTINLVQELDRLRTGLEVYTSAPAAFGALRAQLRPIAPLGRPEHGLRGHAARLVWTQIVLRARARGARVLLNTVPEGPLGGHPGQV